MTIHQVEFSYNLPEYGVLDIEMDEALDLPEREEIALAEIKQVYDDITDIEITKISVRS